MRDKGISVAAVVARGPRNSSNAAVAVVVAVASSAEMNKEATTGEMATTGEIPVTVAGNRSLKRDLNNLFLLRAFDPFTH